MKKKYGLGEYEFPTQGAAREAVSRILYTRPRNRPLSQEDVALLSALFAQHPQAHDKIGAGIAEIRIESAPGYGNQPCFFLYRTDGSRVDISYRECFRASAHINNVRNAARKAIAQQILDAKALFIQKSGMIVCSVTQEECHPSAIDIDHIPPRTFLALWQEFLDQHRMKEADIALSPSGNGIGDDLANQVVLTSWRAFHYANAHLRALAKATHRKLSAQGHHS